MTSYFRYQTFLLLRALTPFHSLTFLRDTEPDSTASAAAVEAVQDALNHGADPNAVFECTSTHCLYAAIRMHGCKALEALIRAGCDVTNTQALSAAILYGAPESVELLLEAGASPNKTTSIGMHRSYPIAALVFRQDDHQGVIVDILKRYGADLDVVCLLEPAEPWTVLTRAATRRNRVPLITALLAAGATPRLQAVPEGTWLDPQAISLIQAAQRWNARKQWILRCVTIFV